MKKKLLFAVVCVVGVILLQELILALVGVAPAYLTEDPYVGFASPVPHFIAEPTDSATSIVRAAPAKQASLNPVEFAAEKPHGTYRIFCLGGSSTYGRPFWDGTSFSGWLRRLLPAAAPDRRWEVINAGAISYASYRVAAIMQELCAYEPDLFVIYCGHNEFLERRTYQEVFGTPWIVREAAGWASRTRTATFVRGGLDWLGLRRTGTARKANLLPEEIKAIPVRVVGPSDYRRDDTLRRQVTGHFELNLRRMVEMARGAGADVVLVVPASNVRDFAPIRSEHREGMSSEELREWQAAYDRGLTAFRTGRPSEAVEAFGQALSLDDRHAALHYQLARALLVSGDPGKAREHFVRARDEDICPLRAVQEIVDAVRQVGRSTDVPVVDCERLLAEDQAGGVAGFESFHDHVHPRIEANGRIAAGVVEAMAQRGIVRLPDDFSQRVVVDVRRAVRESVDGPRFASELARLAEMLDWLGKRELALKTTLEALELSTAGPLTPRERQAHAASVERALAELLAEEGRTGEAAEHRVEAERIQRGETNDRLRGPPGP